MSASIKKLEDYNPSNFSVSEVSLIFDIQETKVIVTSDMSLVKRNENVKHLYLDGDELQIIDIKIDNRQLDKGEFIYEQACLKLPADKAAFTVQTKVEINPYKNTQLEGLYASQTGLFTQCEAEGFRKITFFLDRPDVMARYKTKIIADKNTFPVLLANGNLSSEGVTENGKHWKAYYDPFPKPSYLFALVAAKLEQTTDFIKTRSGKTAELSIFVEPGKLHLTSFAMDSLKNSIKWDEDTYDLELDLEQYKIVAVGDFNMGAMENKGLNIFNTKYVLADSNTATDRDLMMLDRVIAHEYFHNWTGNRVTCRDWFQLSLKEGLTVFRDQQYGADRYSHSVTRIQEVRQLRSIQFPEDSGPMAHPVRPNQYLEISNFYTSTIYDKGAELVRMIHTIIGNENFQKGMKLYFKRHDGQAVRIEEFLSAMRDASGNQLKNFEEWYKTKGTPCIKAKVLYDKADKKVRLTFQQTNLNEGKTNRPIPIKLGLLDHEGASMNINNYKIIDKNKSILFILDKEIGELTINDISSKPIISVLRDFSAPVKMELEYEDAELVALAKFDPDDFNRWEASQKLVTKTIIDGIKNYPNTQSISSQNLYISVLRENLAEHQSDALFLSEMGTIPSEQYILELLGSLNPADCHEVRNRLRLEIGKQLLESFYSIYKNLCNNNDNDFTPEGIGKRALKNLALNYLLENNEDDFFELALSQVKNSQNMTDTMAAFNGLMNFPCDHRQEAIDWFYNKWKSEELVLDKWFTAQALSRLPNTLETVDSLTKHKKFDIKNPNRMRSLIGVFCHANQNQFNRIDGKGYHLCASYVLKLDTINPQIAARLARAFDSWRKFGEERKQLSEQSLVFIKNSNCSKDLAEVIDKIMG